MSVWITCVYVYMSCAQVCIALLLRTQHHPGVDGRSGHSKDPSLVPHTFLPDSPNSVLAA